VIVYPNKTNLSLLKNLIFILVHQKSSLITTGVQTLTF